MIQLPEFSDKSELFAWLRINKRLLINEKKSENKFSDPVAFHSFTVGSAGKIEKAQSPPDVMNLDEFNVKVVINTTNFLDTCGDVHIPGLWKKSLSESKDIYLLQEHQMKFDHVISDRVIPMTKTVTWKELGFDFEGNTEALIFDSMIEKARNPYMAEQYAKGRVKNHSVGMRYEKIELCINSEYKVDEVEKAFWDKYYPMVANKERADSHGYFFAVTEAKVIEGSAVVMGANVATPTISIGVKALDTAGNTVPEPPNYNKLAELFTFKN